MNKRQGIKIIRCETDSPPVSLLSKRMQRITKQGIRDMKSNKTPVFPMDKAIKAKADFDREKQKKDNNPPRNKGPHEK